MAKRGAKATRTEMTVEELLAAIGIEPDRPLKPAETLPQTLVGQLARQLRAEMAAQATSQRRTFGEVAADWLSRLVRVSPENEQRHLWHLCPLWELRDAGSEEHEDDLTKARIEACLRALDVEHGGTLGPSSLNKALGTGRLVVQDAIANRRWHSANPFDFVKRRRVPKKPWARITADELARALAQLRPDRQRECIWQIHAGTRPGEMRGLQKGDVSLSEGFVTIQRSNGRSTTKTGVTRRIPIPAGARAVLEEAMRLSPSEFVFPNPDGSRQRADSKLSRTLQTAFKAAGIVTGYRFMCRRTECLFRDEQPAKELGRRCPRCNFTMWCEGIPKRVTFYSLRHAAASLHTEAGADAHAMKTALGWAARDVGDDTYRHLSDQQFAEELGKLIITPTADPKLPAPRGGNYSPLNDRKREVRALLEQHPDVGCGALVRLVGQQLGVKTSRAAMNRFIHRSGLGKLRFLDAYRPGADTEALRSRSRAPLSASVHAASEGPKGRRRRADGEAAATSGARPPIERSSMPSMRPSARRVAATVGE